MGDAVQELIGDPRQTGDGALFIKYFVGSAEGNGRVPLGKGDNPAFVVNRRFEPDCRRNRLLFRLPFRLLLPKGRQFIQK
jgi:hypothetical protein